MILNNDYERQIYVGLSTDDWGSFSPNEGDVVYLMDQSKCYMFDGSTMQELPDLGGNCPVPELWSVTVVNNQTVGSSTAKRLIIYNTYDSDTSGFRRQNLQAGVTGTYSLQKSQLSGENYLGSYLVVESGKSSLAINNVNINGTQISTTAYQYPLFVNANNLSYTITDPV